MTNAQITNILLIIGIVGILARGVQDAIDFYASRSKKPLPKQLLTVKEVADFLVAEAATLSTATGSDKKSWATSMLIKEKPNLSEAVAQGAIQKAYNDAQKADSNADNDAKPIGFVGTDDKQGD